MSPFSFAENGLTVPVAAPRPTQEETVAIDPGVLASSGPHQGFEDSPDTWKTRFCC